MHKIATDVRTAGKSLSICGEMAVNPAAAVLLMAMGFEILSMNATNLLKVKSVIRNLTLDQAVRLLDKALEHAATELPHDYGFKKIAVKNPYAAPLGSVLVYGGRDAGHVEIRTKNGFVSDYFSSTPRAGRPFIGAFVLPRS